MRHPFNSAPAAARNRAGKPSVDLRAILLGFAGLMALAMAALFPSTAAAVPGSGEFVALESGSGREITELYNMIARICLFILIIVEGVLLFAIIKFRRRSDDENPVQNHGSLRLEFGWTMAALAIQVWIGVATIDVMFSTETEPEAGIDMTVTAYAEMWDWNFEYVPNDDDIFPTDERLIHEDLVIPAHKNVKIQVTSEDVIHAIFIPALGIKMDAVPGRFNHWWIRADGPIGQVRADDYATVGRSDYQYPQTRSGLLREGEDASARRVTGLEQFVDFLAEGRTAPERLEDSPYYGYNAIEYQGTCAELCGRGHWDMYFRTVVMTPSSFQRWYMDELADVEVADGESIYDAQCAECHGDDGTGIGADPALAGNPIVADEANIDEHIEIVLEGPGRMPAFRGTLNDAEIAEVINHERTAWGNEGGTIEPEDVAQMREALGYSPFPAADVDPVSVEDLMRTGERLYRACASCHGDDGRAFDTDFVPDLAGNDTVLADDPDELVRILLEGQDSPQYPGQKRPVARSLSDLELASLLTYIRQSFDNDAPEVQPFDVDDIRGDLN